ncbi:hypothetical protein KUCAC02_007830, partial [Chaenocephalus aceratus]
GVGVAVLQNEEERWDSRCQSNVLYQRGDAFPLYAPHIPESVTRPVASGRQNELSSLPESGHRDPEGNWMLPAKVSFNIPQFQ